MTRNNNMGRRNNSGRNPAKERRSMNFATAVAAVVCRPGAAEE
jgi:hypothetical protein